MSEQSKAYLRRTLLRQLDSLRLSESAKNAEWRKSHSDYQALAQDPQYRRIATEWQAMIQQDEQERAIFKGRWWGDLTDAEKAKCKELDAALRERLLPLQREIIKLLDDYTVPAKPEQGERNGGAGKTPKRGRQVDTDVAADKKVADAWATRRYKTYADLERELNLGKDHVKRALDRHRHRVK